jgi:nifR3 family TIM-barrel protein
MIPSPHPRIQIGPVRLESPFVVAPMAGMTDTAFRRLVKRHGGCGLVVTEMVSSEGLVRGSDRTLEYAEYTEEERPVSIQIFGGDPARMAEAARVVEGMGADIVDVNMGCPVPKIAKHQAGCSLMRDPQHAAAIVAKMVKAVRIPVTVKMRKGWDEDAINAPDVARRVADAGAAAVAIHGRTAKQSYSGEADWPFVGALADTLAIPVFGSGDCVEAHHIVERLRQGVSGVFVGRGVLRNPWILSQARDVIEGRPPRDVSAHDRAAFLLEYIDLLMDERADETAGFRHLAPGAAESLPGGRGRERWVINKLRALCAWYTKGFEGGAHLRLAVNRVESVSELRALIQHFFLSGDEETGSGVLSDSANAAMPTVRRI